MPCRDKLEKQVRVCRNSIEVSPVFSSAATSLGHSRPYHKNTRVKVVTTGLMVGHQHDLFLATRTGQIRQVQQILSKRPDDLNRVSTEDAITLVYHAAFCGHKELLLWLLEEGGQADWLRTYMVSCNIIRDILKP